MTYRMDGPYGIHSHMTVMQRKGIELCFKLRMFTEAVTKQCQQRENSQVNSRDTISASSHLSTLYIVEEESSNSILLEWKTSLEHLSPMPKVPELPNGAFSI